MTYSSGIASYADLVFGVSPLSIDHRLRCHGYGYIQILEKALENQLPICYILPSTLQSPIKLNKAKNKAINKAKNKAKQNKAKKMLEVLYKR